MATGIHAVDKVHMGKSDSSVMYIPVCPVTETNADYLAKQRETFSGEFPGPDFPGGKGESEHSGRPTVAYLQKFFNSEALRAMGMEKLATVDGKDALGPNTAIQKANALLGFA
jgi:hypothetical protein